MSKILLVDFKKRQLECSFDDESKKRIDKIEESFLDVLRTIHTMGVDELYFDYCVHTLGNIVSNLRHNT